MVQVSRVTVTLWVVCALVGLALFTVSHIHGITDPEQFHDPVALLVQAQPKMALAISVSIVLLVPLLVGRPPSPWCIPVSHVFHSIQVTRSPPVSPL